jgi:hypothetical protein
MSLVKTPVKIPADTTLKGAAISVRKQAEEIALERTSTSGLRILAHHQVADALDYLSRHCLSTSQIPESPEARALWQTGALPRAEISRVGCMVPAEPGERATRAK